MRSTQNSTSPCSPRDRADPRIETPASEQPRGDIGCLRDRHDRADNTQLPSVPLAHGLMLSRWVDFGIERSATAAQLPSASRLDPTRPFGKPWGKPLRLRSGRLGHADPAITLRVYAHLSRAAENAVADVSPVSPGISLPGSA